MTFGSKKNSERLYMRFFKKILVWVKEIFFSIKNRLPFFPPLSAPQKHRRMMDDEPAKKKWKAISLAKRANFETFSHKILC